MDHEVPQTERRGTCVFQQAQVERRGRQEPKSREGAGGEGGKRERESGRQGGLLTGKGGGTRGRAR